MRFFTVQVFQDSQENLMNLPFDLKISINLEILSNYCGQLRKPKL